VKIVGDNTFGTKFKITSFGESHGNLIGVIVDGTPAGIDLDLEFIQSELNKRRSKQSQLSTSRKEPDNAKILSGIFNGKTTGAPICLVIENKDVDSSEYEKFRKYLRPSQIDYMSIKKYGGFADYRGSGRFSGRITAGFVMAGAIAKLILKKFNVNVFAYTKSIGNIVDEESYDVTDYENIDNTRESSAIRALNKEKSKLMENLIIKVKEQKDSIGGTVKCIVYNYPSGIGGPIFNSIESNISKAIFSIPAVKGIEFGAGFKASTMKGSEHNDPWIVENENIKTTKNDSGGIIGGISTGMPIEFTVAIKPTATIGISQKTVNVETMQNVEVQFTGRHDPCIVPRAVVVVEAMASVVLLDFLLTEGKIPSVIRD
jgi:chorismate synthase